MYQRPLSSMPGQIRCIECSDGTLMNRVPADPGDTQNAKYRCTKMHIRKIKKISSLRAERNQLPNGAA